MFKIRIMDSMSALRTRLETEKPNFLVRGLVNEATTPGVLNIWVWDGSRGNSRRREFYSRYKLNRKPSRTDIYQGLEFMREVLSYTPAWQCRHDDFEGDDLIAALVQLFPNDPIEIVSTDRDLIALTDGIRVTCTANAFPFPRQYVRLYKLAVGDKSDNIGGIPGYGQKSWDGADKLALAHVLDKIVEGRPVTEGAYDAAQINPSVRKWLEAEGPTQLPILHRVIAPLPVSDEQMQSALWKGVDNPERREALLKEYFL